MVLFVVGVLTPPLAISVWAPKSSLLSRDVNLTVNYVRNTGRVTHSFNRLAVCALERERERAGTSVTDCHMDWYCTMHCRKRQSTVRAFVFCWRNDIRRSTVEGNINSLNTKVSFPFPVNCMRNACKKLWYCGYSQYMVTMQIPVPWSDKKKNVWKSL
jgi:hypothetical protein